MTPEEKARVKIDKQLKSVGWDVVARNDYIPNTTSAIKEALMVGNNESDYLLFVDNKAIAVVEAKREENPLMEAVAQQAENYAISPQDWYGLWEDNIIPLVYLANGNKIYFKNMLTNPDGDYVELKDFHSPKKMFQIIGKFSEYGALPLLDPKGLRNCQYNAEIGLEKSFKEGKKKALAVLATGSGKTYLACLASYRLLNYTPVKRILFLVDRNNLARQTESEFSLFDRTEKGLPMSGLYNINRLRKNEDIKGDIIISTIQKLFAVLTGQQLSGDDDEDAEDEFSIKENDKKGKDIVLGDNLMLPPDYFQFIVVDECHRSIYGKWQSVLKYFSNARIMGLTATPTPEAYAFFDNNIIEKYTYEDSIVDGVNVPNRVYRIKTQVSEHGGTIKENEKVIETNKRTGEVTTNDIHDRIDYSNKALDHSVNDGIITNIPETITESALKETSVRLNPIGSILIAMYGATIGKLGILGIEATTNQACCACIPNASVLAQYLFQFLLSQRQWFIDKGVGGAQPNISKEKIVATIIAVPPIKEQQRIIDSIKELNTVITAIEASLN